MAVKPGRAAIEDERVIGLDFLVTGNSREDHLGTAAKAGEIVMAHRTHRHQEVALDRGTVQPK